MAALLALLVAACAQKPDLGREGPGALELFVESLPAKDGKPRDVQLPLTDAERDLRRISENLVAARPANGGRLAHVTDWLEAQAKNPLPDNIRYYEKLRAVHRGSPVSLVNAMADDIAADSFEMDLFAAALDEVIAADASRADGLLAAGGEGPAAFAAMRGRVAENGAEIEKTVGALATRLAAYRTALAHARLDAPVGDRLAVAEEAIAEMETRVALLDRGAVRHAAIVESMTTGI